MDLLEPSALVLDELLQIVGVHAGVESVADLPLNEQGEVLLNVVLDTVEVCKHRLRLILDLPGHPYTVLNALDFDFGVLLSGHDFGDLLLELVGWLLELVLLGVELMQVVAMQVHFALNDREHLVVLVDRVFRVVVALHDLVRQGLQTLVQVVFEVRVVVPQVDEVVINGVFRHVENLDPFVSFKIFKLHVLYYLVELRFVLLCYLLIVLNVVLNDVQSIVYFFKDWNSISLVQNNVLQILNFIGVLFYLTPHVVYVLTILNRLFELRFQNLLHKHSNLRFHFKPLKFSHFQLLSVLKILF